MSATLRRRWSDGARRDLAFGVLTLALFGLVAWRVPGFASARNVAELFDDTAILILLALGQMLVILVRGIDLSVAANLALCGMLAAQVDRAFPGAGVAVALALSLGAGALLGAFNGVLVWKLRLPPIVVTLGTMSVYRGIIYLLSHGTWVNEHEMSPEFVAFTRHTFLGLTLLAWLALGVAAAFVLALRHLRLARDLFAAGGNQQAAAYSGIDSGRMQFWAFTVCGAIAGVCGYLWVARFAVASTDVALGVELQVIAACLIGGVAIAGGVGSAVGVVLGCLFIGIIANSLPRLGISPLWQMFINGAVILVAVLLSARRRESKRATLEAHGA